MGIPGLKSRLQHFSKDIEWFKPQREGKVSEQQWLETSTKFVIDGPSFAYHIFHLCIASPGDSRKQPHEVPSYQELGQAAVLWLDKVEQFDIHVKRIFFDGYLPTAKMKTRLRRLQASSNQLRALRSTWSASSATSSTSLDLQHVNATSVASSAWRDHRGVRPAPPFLVPSVVDALRDSQFSDRVHIVAGEADAFCAGQACGPGDAILSNDSDLVLYDTPAKIVPLEDLRFVTKADAPDVLQGSYYTRAHIAQRLETQDILKVAFHLYIDCHKSLRACAELAAGYFSSVKLANEFKEFQKAYAAQTYSSCTLNAQLCSSHARLLSVAERLDPRASELLISWAQAIQARCDNTPSNESGVSALVSPREISMCLYPLLDDPTRSSAWRPSYPIRRVAYSLLAMYAASIGVIEVDRRGQQIRQCQTPSLEPDELRTHCTELLKKLPKITGEGCLEKAVDSWKACACVLLIEQLNIEGQLPQQHLLLALLQGEGDSNSVWERLHFVAQVEGMLYSLTLLKHVTKTLHLGTCNAPNHANVAGEVHELSRLLSSIPDLKHLVHTSGDDSFLLSALGLETVQASIRTMSQGFSLPSHNLPFKTQKASKKRRKKEVRPIKRISSGLESFENIYTVLTS